MGVTIRYVLLALITVLLSLICTQAMRKTFSRFRSRERKAGKELIYRHFPRHKKPLGGGMAIFGALILGLLLAPLFGLEVTPDVWVCLLAGVLFAGIGMIDDWRKVMAARGLSEWMKLLLQAICAAVIVIAIFSVKARHIGLHAPTDVFLPFLGWTTFYRLFVPFGMFVIIAMGNAVNLTDGMDGLAGSTLAITFLGYLLLGGLLQHDGIPLLIPILVVASLLGFLHYNRPTATIIMGDTGALGLGALLATLALVSGSEWLLLLFGAAFVINTVSVLIQVSVIKFFRGPVKLLRHQTTEIFRPFLCTPLHHHFQWLAWGPWPVLALYSGVGLVSALLALLAMPAKDNSAGAGWFWLAGLLLQVGVLIFAAIQKSIRANYFLGIERPEGHDERMLALYKGLPMDILGMRCYTLEEISEISEGMVNAIAAESILWRNISEIEARATLGKIYAEYKLFDRAAEEWEEIPLRNLLIRENVVVQLGKIYFGRDELLRAVKLWEQLPAARLARVPGLPETIQSAKVRVGHLAGRLYHQAREHTTALVRQSKRIAPPSAPELTGLITEIEVSLRYTQDLRDLLSYEQTKAEGAGELEGQGNGVDLYRRMDATLVTRREELLEALRWAQAQLAEPVADAEIHGPLRELSQALNLTPAEISHALEITSPLAVREFSRLRKPSRNTLYHIQLDGKETAQRTALIAKCYEDSKVAFFSACYRRERGVLQILQEVDAPTPRIFGGHLGAHMAVLFLEDLGTQDFSEALRAIPADEHSARMSLLRRGIETLVMLRIHALPALPQLEREIAKIVKEVLTPEYYANSITIALERILALDRRRLSSAERNRLEASLRPLVNVLLEEPKTFIHFEYTPGNLHLVDNQVRAVDFEQSTMGPAAFDLATLLYAPEVNLTDAEVGELLAFYHELLPTATPAALVVRPEALEAAAIMKSLFYAGSAANFYRKFEETYRITLMEWYLRTADRLLLHNPAYHDLAAALRHCWQTHPAARNVTPRLPGLTGI